MLIGKKCKVGNRSNQALDDFEFYEGIIASEASMLEDDEFRLLVLTEGKLVIADTYFIYDIKDVEIIEVPISNSNLNDKSKNESNNEDIEDESCCFKTKNHVWNKETKTAWCSVCNTNTDIPF